MPSALSEKFIPCKRLLLLSCVFVFGRVRFLSYVFYSEEVLAVRTLFELHRNFIIFSFLP